MRATMNESNAALQGEIDSLNAAYGLCLDDNRLEDWPDFFVEDCLYNIIARENVDLDLPASVMYCDSKGMLHDRVAALRQANIFPEHYNRHIIGRSEIKQLENDLIFAEASYAVFQTRNDGESRIYNVGKYVDRLVRTEGEGTLRISQRSCVYDTHRLATLLATPI